MAVRELKILRPLSGKIPTQQLVKMRKRPDKYSIIATVTTMLK